MALDVLSKTYCSRHVARFSVMGASFLTSVHTGGRCPVTGMHRAEFTDGVVEGLKPAVEIGAGGSLPRQGVGHRYGFVGGQGRRCAAVTQDRGWAAPTAVANRVRRSAVCGEASLDDRGNGLSREEGTEFHNPVEKASKGAYMGARFTQPTRAPTTRRSGLVGALGREGTRLSRGYVGCTTCQSFSGRIQLRTPVRSVSRRYSNITEVRRRRGPGTHGALFLHPPLGLLPAIRAHP